MLKLVEDSFRFQYASGEWSASFLTRKKGREILAADCTEGKIQYPEVLSNNAALNRQDMLEEDDMLDKLLEDAKFVGRVAPHIPRPPWPRFN